jgi:hypothetical protein
MKLQKSARVFVVLSSTVSFFILMMLGACTRSSSPLNFTEERSLYFSRRLSAGDSVVQPDASDWENHAWLERVSRLLRGGQAVSPALAASLAAQGKEAAIDSLMADPLFGDTVLDFNLYFLGAKPDQIADPTHSEYNSAIFDYPQAITSAQETVKGGDFLKLLDYDQPIYLGVLGPTYSDDSSDQGLGPAETRKRIFERMRVGVEQMIAWLAQNPGVELPQFCVKFGELTGGSHQFLTSGVAVGRFGDVVLSPDWYGIDSLCASSGVGPIDFMAVLERIKRVNEVFFARIAAFEKDDYPARDVRDIREFVLRDVLPSVSWTQFGWKQAQTLVNSSTNYDRKRAAYVLKRFFCDDLTPIAVESPAVHALDRHGSDPSCLSCHYKLDPMAGFFKDYGNGFADFSQAKSIEFDDLATMDRDVYAQAWKAPPGLGREWNIGYIRSVNTPQLNDYGATLEDLFAIIRKAPETRACLVRRMFEYFAGADRMLDPGYLESLTQGFNAAAANGASSAGFKATVKKILLSSSFAQTDPVPGQCYDFAPDTVATGALASSRPPCAVAYLLQKNCVSCHSSPDTGGAGLDLAHWDRLSNGSTGFAQLDESGKQRSRKDVFDAIVDRLSSSDTAFRMPRGRFMSASDREQLYLWAIQEGSR